jgi:3-oxoacyl-[acyl-carrier protein] reductase
MRTPQALSPLSPDRLGPPPGARVVVVGGCGGIGRAVVAALHATGVAVAVLDLPASIARHAPPAGVPAIGLDAADEHSVAAAFAALGWPAFDGAVNLVGFMTEKTAVAAMPAAAWDALIAGNLRSAFLVAREALPGLHAAGGALVNVASGLALRVMPGYAGYAAAKAGMIALTKAIAAENAPAVRANCVAPGAVDTAFLTGGTGREGLGAGSGLDAARYVQTIPLGRIAVPDDVVGPVLFLLGDASRYMTGQTLYVNGGGQMP